MTKQELDAIADAMDQTAALLEEASKREEVIETGGPLSPNRKGVKQDSPCVVLLSQAQRIRKDRDQIIAACLPLLSDADFAAVSAKYRKLIMPAKP
jgi:hypothetical protein